MEQQYIHTVDGQAVLKADLDRMGEGAALADDRVLAEFFRLTPFDGSAVSRGVIASGSFVMPNGASGTVLVNPFRAVIGSRTAASVDAKKCYRDIRSAVFADPFLGGPIGKPVVLADNSSGNPRWDLIYATLTPDVDIAATDRKAKNLTTDVVANVSVPAYRQTTVTVSVLAGTPSATPNWPATPVDGVGAYIIPLAYVFVPDAFDGTAIVGAGDIAMVAPCLTPASASGAHNASVASANSKMTSAQQHAWAGGGRPTHVMPSTMTGGETLWLALDLRDASSANHSIAISTPLDDRDWRGRLCSWMAVAGASADPAWLVSDPGGATTPSGSSLDIITTANNETLVGMGQTMWKDFDGTIGNTSKVARLDSGDTDALTAAVHIYCDMADGKLKMFWSVNPRSFIVMRIDFSGVFSNVR